jgi:hypothetical protein
MPARFRRQTAQRGDLVLPRNAPPYGSLSVSPVENTKYTRAWLGQIAAACCAQGRLVMIVQFPHTTAGYTYTGTVSFIAIVDGAEVLCEISPEALEDHFGATHTDRSCLLAAFEGHRAEIESVAAAILPFRLKERRCPLFSRDFRYQPAADMPVILEDPLRSQSDHHYPAAVAVNAADRDRQAAISSLASQVDGQGDQRLEDAMSSSMNRRIASASTSRG